MGGKDENTPHEKLTGVTYECHLQANGPCMAVGALSGSWVQFLKFTIIRKDWIYESLLWVIVPAQRTAVKLLDPPESQRLVYGSHLWFVYPFTVRRP